jgi:hypothetical protein
MSHPIYVPILKGREGEYAALQELDPIIKGLVLPLIETPSVPYDFQKERQAKTLDEHVSGIPDRLRRCWGSVGPVLLDMPWFEEGERLSDGSVALESVLSRCSDVNVDVIPVVARTSSTGYKSAARAHAVRTTRGVCLRLKEVDFADDINLDTEISQLLDELGGLSPDRVDLLIDLDDLGQNPGRAGLVARYVLGQVPAGPWRRVVLGAASFPEDLSEVDARTVARLPRFEWNLWTGLKKWIRLQRPDLVFADYAISHPRLRELDPRIMRMSASIRYTTADAWLVLKGRNVRQFGFEQYFDLCQELVNQPEYCGADFSWGDRFVAECASRETGPGNATTWRKVGTNHHITLVARSLSAQRDEA